MSFTIYYFNLEANNKKICFARTMKLIYFKISNTLQMLLIFYTSRFSKA